MNALTRRTGLASRIELAALAMSMGVMPDPLYGRATGQDCKKLIEIDDPPVPFENGY